MLERAQSASRLGAWAPVAHGVPRTQNQGHSCVKPKILANERMRARRHTSTTPMPRRASTYHDTEKANSGELDNSGGFVSGADIIRRERGVFPRAPSTPRRSVATPSSLYPPLLDGVLRAGRRGRIGRSGESSSRRSRGSYRAPTPPWWTRSRDAGLAAEFFLFRF